MKIVLCGYGNPDNRGCEAIIRTTTGMLREMMPDSNIVAMSNDYERIEMLDIPAIDAYEKSYYPHENTLDFYIYAIINKIFHTTKKWCMLHNSEAYKRIGECDVCISVGGDNFCYSDQVDHFLVHHQHFQKCGAKLVHWGSSFEKKLMSPKLVNDLNSFSAIIVRESISEENVKQSGVSAPVYLVPDPAFDMRPEKPEDNIIIPKNSVGVNISPLIISRETKSGVTRKNAIELINYLTDKGYNVVCIPHVADRRTGEGDYSVMKDLLKEINQPEKCILINYSYTAPELKYIISKCKFFIGARTHATIAAYSMCVPTLVIGYSVKALGIAKDLFGTNEGYVLPVQSLENPYQMIEAFKGIEKNENLIRERLEKIMPEYCNRARDAMDIINSVCKGGK